MLPTDATIPTPQYPARPAAAPERLVTRSREFLEILKWRADSPGVCLVSITDGVHEPIANLGYDDAVLHYLTSNSWVKECEGFACVRSNPGKSLDWDHIPRFRESLSARDVFVPAGFQNGVSTMLTNNSGKSIGVVHFATETEQINDPTFRLLNSIVPVVTAHVEAEAALRRGQLTTRELEVTSLIRRGLSNREIAAELFLSSRTVSTHVESILRKLDLDNRTEVAVVAERWDLS